MGASKNIHFLSDPQSALTEISNFILSSHSNRPVLTHTQVIFNESRLAIPFRAALLDAAAHQQQPALLGPYFFSLEQWLEHYIPDEVVVCDEQVRLLILVEALLDTPQLLKQANPWTLADSLLHLFDELSLNAITLDMNASQFNESLSQWYATHKQDRPKFSGLDHEAELIYQLWHAWHEQLDANHLIDNTTASLLGLKRSLQDDFSRQQLHIIGIEPHYLSQKSWLKEIIKKQNVHLWLLGQAMMAPGTCRSDDRIYHVAESLALPIEKTKHTTEYSQALANIFCRQPQIKIRAQQFAQQYPQSPIRERISIYRAKSAEQQTHAIDTQIRKWILDGKQRIAVISENRLLARRLRALLDRADIPLYDAAGWALSTTRAAASIESLLLCIEEDFEKDALLDLLKSGLLKTTETTQSFKHLIYRLEHDIIQNEQITHNLERYQQAILNRQHRLKDIWPFAPTDLVTLLKSIHTATAPLTTLLDKQLSLETILSELISTLDQLGLSAGFRRDPAGKMILNTLHDMLTATQQQPITSTWPQFRAWLARNLESRYFQPNPSSHGVQLLNLAQAEFQNFDALIIAGMEHEYFPGSPPALAFFNNQVRKQLQLPELQHFHDQRLRQFYNLLHSADSILLSYRDEQDGQAINISPWVNAIEQFHKLAYNETLSADALINTLHAQDTQVIRCDTRELPKRQLRPMPSITKELVPHTLSASSYQQIVNCPYQFFAINCLKLRAPEEIQLALSKREYGERAHLCLQAFHSEVKNLPGPYLEQLTEQTRAEAIEMMTRITESIFVDDLKQNHSHLGWYHQWLKVIPVYIDWHIKNKAHATVKQTEQKVERQISETLTINGRIDRIDIENGTLQIIDYKTGTLPSNKDVLNGEQVQLPFYALLSNTTQRPVQTAGYLAIGKENNFKASFPLKDEELNELAEKTLHRLTKMITEMEQGQALPAWEDDAVCQYCDMKTLCRAGTW